MCVTRSHFRILIQLEGRACVGRDNEIVILIKSGKIYYYAVTRRTRAVPLCYAFIMHNSNTYYTIYIY